jgi:hypothetical protein
MQFLIKGKQKVEIDKYLALFCSFDREQELLLSLICEERRKEMDSLLSGTFYPQNYYKESVFTHVFKLLHPENLAGMLLQECPLVNKIILNAIPDYLSEMVQLYLPPEVISKIRGVNLCFNMECSDMVVARFANQIIQDFNKCMEGLSESIENSDILSALITLSYDEIFTLLKSAGEFALNNNTRTQIAPGRNEHLFAGYTLLAVLMAEQKDAVKKFIMNKFPREVQRVLNSLMSDRNEEIKWLKQRSEETFRTVLKIS